LFVPANIARALARWATRNDKDELVAHPVRAAVLIEFKDELTEMISQAVLAGGWSAERAYMCVSQKRAGTPRDLVFPSLLDTIVGRIIIDALEPDITDDDGDSTFSGRSHANANREPGDYESWFHVWRDFTASVERAAQKEGYAYVFSTDIADFFPTVDRQRAKQALAHRTQATPALLELLFHCLESWLPRYAYSTATGLPVEDNDVSRLVAHNYLKSLDARFTDIPNWVYLRYDTIFVVRTEGEADQARAQHHKALRELGLNPNASKTEVLTTTEFERRRCRAMNLRLDRVQKNFQECELKELVLEAHGEVSALEDSRGHLLRRLYSIATANSSTCLLSHTVADLSDSTDPRLTYRVFKYLKSVPNSIPLDELFRACSSTSAEQLIHWGGYLCDGAFPVSERSRLLECCLAGLRGQAQSQGCGYAKSLYLLALHKHADVGLRNEIHSWATGESFVDERLRLAYLYVATCRRELKPDLARKLRQWPSTDIELTLRLCEAASAGTLRSQKRILARMTSKCGRRPVLEAKYLPLLWAMVDGASVSRTRSGLAQEMEAWLTSATRKHESDLSTVRQLGWLAARLTS
jgi:hypothetical protein